MQTEGQQAELESIESTVTRLAGMLAHRGGTLSAGDVASLRRMAPARPVAAFFKLSGTLLEQRLPRDESLRADAETRWASIIVGLAHLGDLYRPGVRFGRALAESGLSEIRFSRLLRADSVRLVDELPTLGRFLLAKGQPTDWSGAARIILSSGRSDEESIRRRMARDFYAGSNHSST